MTFTERATIDGLQQRVTLLTTQLAAVTEERDAFEEQVYDLKFQREHTDMQYESIKLALDWQLHKPWWRKVLGL
jgi:uncharacterized protein YhaN